MKMMNKSLFSLGAILMLVLFFGLNANAQKNDPAATKVLNAVSAKFKTLKTVQANYSLRVEDAAGKLLDSESGKMFLKGDKYRLQGSSNDIYCDGTTIWDHDKKGKEVTISKLDQSSGSLTPQKLFTDFYTKDFLYRLNGNTKFNGKTVKEIELTPRDKSKVYFKVMLYISDNMIVGTKIFEKAGRRMTYSTSNVVSNVAISDDTFVYNASKNPGVEIVDLR